MTFEELKKKLKQAQNIKILFQELENNEFIATIKGIINSMEKKKSKLDLIIDELKEIKIKVNNIVHEAIKHGWDLNSDQ